MHFSGRKHPGCPGATKQCRDMLRWLECRPWASESGEKSFSILLCPIRPVCVLKLSLWRWNMTCDSIDNYTCVFAGCTVAGQVQKMIPPSNMTCPCDCRVSPTKWSTAGQVDGWHNVLQSITLQGTPEQTGVFVLMVAECFFVSGYFHLFPLHIASRFSSLEQLDDGIRWSCCDAHVFTKSIKRAFHLRHVDWECSLNMIRNVQKKADTPNGYVQYIRYVLVRSCANPANPANQYLQRPCAKRCKTAQDVQALNT